MIKKIISIIFISSIFSINSFAYGSMGCDDKTVLLSHADGFNTSTSFIEENCQGTAKKTFTANGNAQISTAQYFFGGASASFDGSGDSISTVSSADFNFGAGDFTLEARIRVNTVKQCYIFNRGLNNDCDMILEYTPGVFACFIMSPTPLISASWSPTANTWYHIAFIRKGTACNFYVNGISMGSATSSASISSSNDYYFGSLANGAAGYDGYMDEIRISNVARWVNNFTPPTSPYCSGCEMIGTN